MLVGLGYYLFLRGKGGLLSCVPLVNILKQVHTCGLIFQKFMHIITQWRTQAKRLQAFPHVLTTILNLGVVIVVIDG
jgi:uncharacterized membrane protein